MNVFDEKPYPFTKEHPALRIPGWKELLGPGEQMPVVEAVRHFLHTGETGSGKSASGVIPLLKAVLRYPEPSCYAAYQASAGTKAESRRHLRPAALVVDPKHELGEAVYENRAGRKVTTLTYGVPGETLDFFEGSDLSEMSKIDVVHAVIQQSEAYSRDMATTREPIWSIRAANLIQDFLAVDMFLAKQGMDKLKEFWSTIRAKLESSSYAALCSTLTYNRANYFKPIAMLVAAANGEESSYPLAVYGDVAESIGVPAEMLASLMTLTTLAQNTKSSVLWMADGILADIASEQFAACISLNPIERPERAFSVRAMLDNGDVLVYRPTSTPSPIADTLGRCIKTKLLQFVFQRANKVRPFAYIVDEAHRFVTAGEQDGEQSLLDRCRAYRTIVVLATQSIASLRVRIEGSSPAGAAALQVILNNCGNALYFRSPDVSTQDNLQARIPGCPVMGRPHVVKIRPLTSLGTGSCYALRANGTWGIFQVHLNN